MVRRWHNGSLHNVKTETARQTGRLYFSWRLFWVKIISEATRQHVIGVLLVFVQIHINHGLVMDSEGQFFFWPCLRMGDGDLGQRRYVPMLPMFTKRPRFGDGLGRAILILMTYPEPSRPGTVLVNEPCDNLTPLSFLVYFTS